MVFHQVVDTVSAKLNMAATHDNRRQFLSRCTSLLLTVIGGAMAVPVLGYVLGRCDGARMARAQKRLLILALWQI